MSITAEIARRIARNECVCADLGIAAGRHHQDCPQATPATIAWPDVDVDEHGRITCPIPTCEEVLYLFREFAEELIAEQEPDLPDAATVFQWKVACATGHVIWTIVDRAVLVGGDPTDPDAEYDHYDLHKIVSRLLGHDESDSPK